MSINLLLICVIIVAVVTVLRGYKRGMIKSIISLVSLLVLCVMAVLLANGISSYNQGKTFHVILMVILLALLGLAHHLLSVVFFSAKLVSKLPVIHSVDKLLGIVFGLVEAILLLWTVYTFVIMMNLGMLEAKILECTSENSILTWFYQNNLLAHGISMLLDKFSFIPLNEILSLGK